MLLAYLPHQVKPEDDKLTNSDTGAKHTVILGQNIPEQLFSSN